MNRTLRSEYLAAMGLEAWVVRRAPDTLAAPGAGTPGTAVALTAGSPGAATSETAVALAAALPAPAAPETASTATPTRPAARHAHTAHASGAPEQAQREAAFGWEELRARVAVCTRCALSTTRTQTVFGVGYRQAEWLVVGEAPGADEDIAGEPFVGRAGQLLNSMLRAIGLARERVYIANVLKCRPPGNREPATNETLECLPYLEQQIALLRPKILLAVGRVAAQNLLRTNTPLGRLRQQVHTFGGSRVPLVVTYHPAYLLRTPADKRKAWEDLKFARGVSARV